MAAYRFVIQPKSDSSTELLDDRHEFHCENNLAAIREAEIMLKRLRPGLLAQLFDPSGIMIWMDVASE